MEFLFLLITEISVFCGLVLFYKGMLWLVDKAYSDLNDWFNEIKMIDIIQTLCLLGIILVGIIFPTCLMIYGTVDFIKDEIEIRKLIKRRFR